MTESASEKALREAREALASLHKSARSKDGVDGWEIALAERRLDAAVRAAFEATVDWCDRRDLVGRQPLPAWLPGGKEEKHG